MVESLRVSDVLGFPAFSDAELIAGRSGLEACVDHVNVMQIPTDRFAKPNELLLAAASAITDIKARDLIAALVAKGIAALVVRSPELREILGAEALRVADEGGLPVIAFPESAHLSDAQTTVLEHLITNRAEELKTAADVREELSASALSGGGLTALTRTIATLVEAPVWILDEHQQVHAASDQQNTNRFAKLLDAFLREDFSEPVAAEGFVLAPITVPYRRLGCLVCALKEPFDNRELAAVEHGTTIAALQIAHLQGAEEATMRFRSGFVRDLLTGTLDARSAGRRAASVGWNPKAPYRVMLVTPGKSRHRVSTMLATRLPDAIIANQSGVFLLMIPEYAASDARRLTGDVVTIDEGISVGVSGAHNGLHAFSDALAQAEEALRAARTFDGTDRVRYFEALGPLRFLSAVPREDLERFVDKTLRPLNELDEEYRLTLEETLRHLIDANLNVAQAARDGGWHYNTLRYRIDRLTELLGPFMEDGTVLDSIALALILRDEVRAS